MLPFGLNTHMERTIWCFDLSLQGVNQLHEYVNRSRDPLVRIIHLLNSDCEGCEDRYICLVQCSAQTAVMLSLYD